MLRLGVVYVIYMNMKVANDGCCARKEGVIVWLQVLSIMLLHMEDIHMKKYVTDTILSGNIKFI
jgi:hypothetical protein